MTIYYLYVKTHNKTGLKYLGKTTKDPYKYEGSGTYWNRHINEHGKDIRTEVLKECISNEEVKEWGLYYSELWNIVESNEWANLRPESGDGGPNFGKLNGMYGKKRSKEVMKNAWDAAVKVTKGKTLEEVHGIEKAAVLKQVRSENSKKAVNNDPEWISRLKQNTCSVEAIEKRSGKNHCRYNHSLYVWTHIKTGETMCCTRNDFIKVTGQFSSNVSKLLAGKIKHSRGWSVELMTTNAISHNHDR